MKGLVIENTNINTSIRYELQLDDCTCLFKDLTSLAEYASKHNIDLDWEEEGDQEYDYGF